VVAYDAAGNISPQSNVATATTPGSGGSGSALTVNGAQRFQTMDGFGVSVNSASWKNGELRPAIDMLVDQLGATLFRVIIDNADWEATNDNTDHNTFNWTYYNGVYTTAKFENSGAR
jgi:O-glycosyl hydrolase